MTEDRRPTVRVKMLKVWQRVTVTFSGTLTEPAVITQVSRVTTNLRHHQKGRFVLLRAPLELQGHAKSGSAVMFR